MIWNIIFQCGSHLPMRLTNHCVIAHWGNISISGKTFVIIEYHKQNALVALLLIVDAWYTAIKNVFTPDWSLHMDYGNKFMKLLFISCVSPHQYVKATEINEMKLECYELVYITVYSGSDQRKHQSAASLAFVWGIHRWPVNSPHKEPVTRKMFPFDDVIMWRTVPTKHYWHYVAYMECAHHG